MTIENLTNREKEVLNLLAKGLRNLDISRELCISEHTTKAHLNSIYKKLGVKRKSQAIIIALQ